jgi:ribonuclease III
MNFFKRIGSSISKFFIKKTETSERKRTLQYGESISPVFQIIPPDFKKLEKKLKYKITNQNIFVEALTHRSFSQEDEQKKIRSNERMEFLGDSILNLIVAEFLFNKFPDAEEGNLTKIRSRLVNKKALSEYANKIELFEFLLLSQNAIISFPKGIESILGDAFESMVAGIYLDGGYEQARQFVLGIILSNKETLSKALLDNNYKSALLEYSQAFGLGIPKYQTINESGPNHNPTFTVSVAIGKTHLGQGAGSNKKEAEQHAAKEALMKLSII